MELNNSLLNSFIRTDNLKEVYRYVFSFFLSLRDENENSNFRKTSGSFWKKFLTINRFAILKPGKRNDIINFCVMSSWKIREGKKRKRKKWIGKNLNSSPSCNLIFIKARYISFHLEKNVYATSVEYEAWTRGFTGLFFFLGYNMESLLLIRSYKRNGMLQICVDIIYAYASPVCSLRCIEDNSAISNFVFFFFLFLRILRCAKSLNDKFTRDTVKCD